MLTIRIGKIFCNWRSAMLFLSAITVWLAFVAWQVYNGLVMPLAVSPDGRIIVSCELIYRYQLDRVYAPKITVRNSESGELIAEFGTSFSSRPTATFNVDGSQFAWVDGDSINIVDVNSLTVHSKWNERGLGRVVFDHQGILIQLGVSPSENDDMQKLWIKRGARDSRIEVTEVSSTDHIEAIVVSASGEDAKLYLNSAVKVCGYLLQFDLMSKQLVGTRRECPGWIFAVSPNGQRVAITDLILETESMETSIDMANMMSHAFSRDSQKILAIDGMGQTYVIDKQGNSSKKTARFEEELLSLHWMQENRVAIAATMSGLLLRADLDSGATTTLVDKRKWFVYLLVPTCILAVGWVIGWIYFGFRDRPGLPFLDMFIFHSVVAILTIECGYLVRFRSFQQFDDLVVMLSLGMLGAAFGVMIVWTSLCVRRWNWQIPFATTGIAGVLAVAIWASRYMQVRSWEITVVGTSVFLCTVGTLIAMRRMLGRIGNVSLEPFDEPDESSVSQISLKQILICLSAFALCFAVGRFLQIRSMAFSYYVWLFVYGIVYSFAISGGVWIVFGPHVWWCRVLISTGVIASVWIIHYALTLRLGLLLGTFYFAIPLFVNVMLVVSLVYCRMHGFTFLQKQRQPGLTVEPEVA